MRFPFDFTRRVGGAGVVPVLGTDAVPTDHTHLANTNVFKTKLSAGFPSQRVAVAYKYTGAGVPLNLLCKAYIYDGTSRTWFTIDSLGCVLKPGDIAFLPIPQLIDQPQEPATDPYESTVDSIELAIVVTPPGADPDGTYTFLIGTDISEVSDENGPGAADHVVDTAVETVLGTTADAKVDTDAVGTISSKIRGTVSRLLNIDTTLGAVANAAVDADNDGSINAHVRGIVKLLLGTGKLIVRGGAKGATTAADLTSTPHGADHQGVDTTPYGATAVGATPVAAANPMDIGAVVLDADPAPGTDTQLGRMRLDSLYRLFVRGYNWVSVKGASVALAITGKAVSPNVNAMDTWDNAPTQAIYNYSTARGDAPSPVRATDTTATWAGPTLVSGQMCRIRCFIDATTRPLVWEQGRNAVISIVGTVLTVNALDGTVATIPNTVTYIEVMWAAQDKSFDSSLGATRGAPMYSDRSFRTSTTPTALIAAAQLFTTGWVALGPQFQVDGEKWLRAFLSWTKNNGTATTFQIRAYYSHTSGGTQFPLKVIKVDTSAVPYVVSLGDEIITLATVDQSDLATVVWDLQNCTGYCQFYIYAATPGAAGSAGPGAMATAEYTMGY